MTLIRVHLPSLAIVLFLASESALAGTLTQTAAAPMLLESDSNPTMAVIGKKAITRTIFTPRWDLATIYGGDEYKLGLGLRVERSSDRQISADREDPNLTLGWRRQAENAEFGLTAKYAEASTRFVELEEAGLIQKEGKRKTFSVGGSWSKTIDQRNSLSVGGEFKDVAYEGGTLTDYTNASVNLSYNHIWSEYLEVFVRTGASRYQPSGSLLSSSDNFNVMAGVQWKLSETIDWMVQAGPTRTSGQTHNTGWQGSSSIHYLGQRYDASLDVGRSISASGEGGYVEADQLKGSLGYAIGERTHTGLDVSWRKNWGVVPNTLRQHGIWVSRELSPSWNARLGYQYKQRKQNGLGPAVANVVGLSLIYSLPNF